jgi:acetylornithine/succinyldiaminopimelate/putrescine aminotransferase
MAKALGNGFPIGAMVAKREIADLFSAGRHASTFGGNFLASAVGNAVIDLMTGDRLDREAEKKGGILEEGLLRLKKKYSEIALEVRGLGLMRGVRLNEKIPASEVVVACRKAGLICGSAGQNVLRLLPALTVSAEEIREALGILDKVFAGLISEDKPLLGQMLAADAVGDKKPGKRKTNRKK